MNKRIILEKTLIVLIATFLSLTPVFANVNLFLNRKNDLQEVFWPVFYFIHDNFINLKTIPLWNNLFFSGTPLLPDPQLSIFYPLNFPFIFLPTNFAFILYVVTHTFLASLGMLLFCRSALKLSKKASYFACFAYILHPIFASFLEAGHVTLIGAYAWLPFLFLSIIRLSQKPNLKWLTLFSISLSALFYTHTLIFAVGLVISLAIFATNILNKRKAIIKNSIFVVVGLIITFGFTAIALFPQIEWSSQTTRNLLITNPDVYPKWLTLREFFNALLAPILQTEKDIAIGVLLLFLAIVGFVHLRRQIMIITVSAILIVLIIAAGNLTPFFPILMSQNWFLLLRVTTRIWPFFVFLLIALSSYGLDKLLLKKKRFFSIFAILSLLELLIWNYTIQTKPVQSEQLVSPAVYDYLTLDTDKFRVYCTTRCLSQKDAAIHRLELVEGYNTLQQLNYFKSSWQMMGGYWNYYTLALPPFGSYLIDKVQPNAKALGEFNTKYVLSTYSLTDSSFQLTKKIDSILIYKNDQYLPRSTGNVLLYTPNLIRVETLPGQKSLVLREVFNSGWNAYLNGTDKVGIQETPIAQRLVDLKLDTKFVDFRYEPLSFKIGRIITFLTITVAIIALILKIVYIRL